MTELDQQSEMRRAAMQWLARREYSRQEITRKLERRFGSDAAVLPVLDWLEEQRFLDEQRYLDVFLRSAIDRGHGLLRIRQELQHKGFPAPLIEEKLAALETDWFALAAAVRRRRFGAPPGSADRKEKARQLRFLQYRGFTTDQCFHALSDPED